MKLERELNYVIERFEVLKQRNSEMAIIEYAKAVKESGAYKDFHTRISWDLAHTCIPTNTISDWYEQYQCNDNHITTLFKEALKQVFPQIYEMRGK